MARVRNRIYRAVKRSGERIFRFLSSCEDNRRISKLARFLKLSLLGLAVLVIAACGKKQVPGDDIPLCYTVAESYIKLSEVTAEPNPTENTPHVNIQAHASIEGDTTGKHVTEARAFIGKDTIDLKAIDGEFNGAFEEIEGKFFVGNHKPGNYELRIIATDNLGGRAEEPVNLKVSD